MSTGKNETLYLELEQGARVSKQNITLQDIASIKCTNSTIENDLNHLSCAEIEQEHHKRVVIKLLDIIEKIQTRYPDMEIQSVGETECAAEYIKNPKENKALSIAKTALVGLVVFFGAAFTIMAFNNDVSVRDLFAEIYQSFTGKVSNGTTVLEISYSLGLAAGILVFFHHFGGKRLGNDPTPIEIQMRNYEQDLDNTFIQNDSRGGNQKND